MNKKCSKRLSGFLALVMMLSVILVGMPEVVGAESTCKNLLNNGDFEEWEAGLPVDWYGEKASNIGNQNVKQIDTGAKSSNYAVQLITTSSNHKRFTNKAISIKADVKYTLTYWAKGKGEIRNAFYRDSNYSGYTGYTVLDTDEWQEITYTFSYDKDADDVEIVFSVRSTVEDGGHVQIDDVVLVSDEEEVPLDKVANVTAAPKPGTVRKGTEVILQTSTEDATVYYTIDDTDPTTDSAEYSVPIIINEDTTIKAIAVKEGLDDSDISTFEYTIVELMDIADARTKAIGDYVLVEGIVTFIDGGNNYIQDETAGIDVFIYDVGLKEGDKVSVFGKIADFNGLVEIVPDSVKDVEKISSDNELPAPRTVTIDQVNTDDYQGQLVKIENVTIGAINTGGNTPIIDEDGNTINIYKIPELTDIVEGDKVNVIAIASIFNTPQLRVRSASDIIKVEEPKSNDVSISEVKVAGVEATVDPEDATKYTVTVPYGTELTVESLELTLAAGASKAITLENNVYTVVVTAEDGETTETYTITVSEIEEPVNPDPKYPVLIQEATKTEDKLEVKLYNFEEDMNGIIIIKVLDENGKPYIIDYKDIMNITKGENTVYFTLDSTKYTRGISGVKVYVWKSFNIMKPFARQKTFNLQ